MNKRIKYYYDLLDYCEKNKNIVLSKAKKMYNIFTKSFDELNNTHKKMYGRVNNFKVLEYASKKFEEE